MTQVTNIGSQITSGGNMMLVSGGDQHYQVAKLDSGKDLTLNSGGAIDFEGVKDLHQESHAKSNSSLAWNSMSGKGSTDETLRQSELIAKGNSAIKAVDGLHIDVKQVNQQTVSEAIDAMVKADPNLAWLKDAEKRGDVDWKLIKETHDAYKYSNSGLGLGRNWLSPSWSRISPPVRLALQLPRQQVQPQAPEAQWPRQQSGQRVRPQQPPLQVPLRDLEM